MSPAILTFLFIWMVVPSQSHIDTTQTLGVSKAWTTEIDGLLMTAFCNDEITSLQLCFYHIHQVLDDEICPKWVSNTDLSRNTVSTHRTPCGHIRVKHTNNIFSHTWRIYHRPWYGVNVTILYGHLISATEQCPYVYIEVIGAADQRQKGRLCGNLPAINYYFTYSNTSSPEIEHWRNKNAIHSGDFYIIYQLMGSLIKEYVQVAMTSYMYTQISSQKIELHSPLVELLITADIMHELSVLMALISTSRNRSSAVSIALFEGPFKTIHVRKDYTLNKRQSRISHTSQSFIVLLDITADLEPPDKFLIMYGGLMKNKRHPYNRDKNQDLDISFNTEINWRFNLTNCNMDYHPTNVFCLARLTVPQGSYMRITITEVTNPAYYTQLCHHSGFAFVSTVRSNSRQISSLHHLNHALPIRKFCHGRLGYGTPFPNRHSTFHSSIFIVYFAFLQNGDQVNSVYSRFNLVMAVKRTNCQGISLICLYPFPTGKYPLPYVSTSVKVPANHKCPLNAKCSSSLHITTSTQFKSVISYMYATRRKPIGSETYIAIQIFTESPCLDVQQLPNNKQNITCDVEIAHSRPHQSEHYMFHKYLDHENLSDTYIVDRISFQNDNHKLSVTGMSGQHLYLMVTVKGTCLRYRGKM